MLQVPLKVAAPTLTLTMDVLGGAAGGSVGVGVRAKGRPVAGLSLADCVRVSGNTTNGEVRWKGGANFGRLVGQMVTLELEIASAIVYTIGWAA